MLVFFFCNLTEASVFPRGCEVSGFGFHGNYLIINDNSVQSFYLMQNSSTHSIELRRYETRPDAFMSPSLTTLLASTQWAAFASDVEELHFQCFKKENKTKLIINCSDVLEVCRYPRVKFALSNMGTYWVSANKTQAQVINESVKKGILLRW